LNVKVHRICFIVKKIKEPGVDSPMKLSQSAM
jgi:hypothetical protein